MRKKLFEIAHARSGDKGEITNIVLIPYKEKDYELIKKYVTSDVVKNHFKGLISGQVIRYEIPKLNAFNFVLYGTRIGGVGATLEIDVHGKSYSYGLLEIEIGE